jgi:two-component system chemotaxis response regulator CheB
MNSSPRKIRVLVVDDSAFARKIVREVLCTSPLIEVIGVARDGTEALELMETLQPDLVTCDLVMPKLDGVGFVRAQMARRPVPILILSSVAEDAEKVLEALNAGAVDFIRKPTALANDDLRTIGHRLISQVAAIAQVPMRTLMLERHPPAAVRPGAAHPAKVDIVVLGISTGGPQALRQLIPLLPANFAVPIAIVLHMPVGYTALFAEKLNEISAIEVREAKEGDCLRPGLVLVAAAGRHLAFAKGADGVIRAVLPMQPLEKLHRPSADVLFLSAADLFGERVLAVVMTGMGHDGMEGAAWVKAKGGKVLTESEKSCVIYGMPRSVVEAGLSDAAIPLSEMAQAITDRI